MNSVASVRSTQATKSSKSESGVSVEHRRIDVTGLPADQVAEYLQAGSGREGVYFERRAGKTYAVSPDR